MLVGRNDRGYHFARQTQTDTPNDLGITLAEKRQDVGIEQIERHSSPGGVILDLLAILLHGFSQPIQERMPFQFAG